MNWPAHDENLTLKWSLCRFKCLPAMAWFNLRLWTVAGLKQFSDLSLWVRFLECYDLSQKIDGHWVSEWLNVNFTHLRFFKYLSLMESICLLTSKWSFRERLVRGTIEKFEWWTNKNSHYKFTASCSFFELFKYHSAQLIFTGQFQKVNFNIHRFIQFSLPSFT